MLAVAFLSNRAYALTDKSRSSLRLFEAIQTNKSEPTKVSHRRSSLLKDLGKGTIRMPYQTVNPFNGEVLRTFDEHTDQQMEQMLANADKTFREIWSKKPVRDRAKIVGKAASPDAGAKGEVCRGWRHSKWESGSRRAAEKWSLAPQS